MAERFIVKERRRDDDSYMYSDTSYTYLVISVETGDELMRFEGSVDRNSSGTSSSGARWVEILDDAEVRVTDYDGQIELHPLPRTLRISEDGNKIVLVYGDGRSEERERNQPMFAGKYGDWFTAGELVHPPAKPS